MSTCVSAVLAIGVLCHNAAFDLRQTHLERERQARNRDGYDNKRITLHLGR
jgi:hypothetical protein